MKNWIALFVVLPMVAGCQPNPPVATKNDTPTPPKSEAPSGEKPKAVPAEFQHDAYRYYSLSRTSPATHSLQVGNADPMIGTHTTTLDEVSNESAKYSLERTAGLASLGNDKLLLTKDGVHVESSSIAKLEGTTLMMPAKLSKGTTWTVRNKMTMSDGRVMEEATKYKVVGEQRIKVDAGEFVALFITSTGDAVVDGKKSRIETKGWYVKDRGSVLLEMTLVPLSKGSGLQPTKIRIEEMKPQQRS